MNVPFGCPECGSVKVRPKSVDRDGLVTLGCADCEHWFDRQAPERSVPRLRDLGTILEAQRRTWQQTPATHPRDRQVALGQYRRTGRMILEALA